MPPATRHVEDQQSQPALLRFVQRGNANSDGSSASGRYRPSAAVALNGPASGRPHHPREARLRPRKNARRAARGVSHASGERLAPQESRAPPSPSPRRIARASAVFALWGPGLMAAGPVPQAYSSPGVKTKKVLNEERPIV